MPLSFSAGNYHSFASVVISSLLVTSTAVLMIFSVFLGAKDTRLAPPISSWAIMLIGVRIQLKCYFLYTFSKFYFPHAFFFFEETMNASPFRVSTVLKENVYNTFPMTFIVNFLRHFIICHSQLFSILELFVCMVEFRRCS
jgi:hypothetical protein